MMDKASRARSERNKRRTGGSAGFAVTIKHSPTPMTQAEWEASEDLLATMVARAIAADHPEWFGEGKTSNESAKPEKKDDDQRD
jgi:hypothetical protein